MLLLWGQVAVTLKDGADATLDTGWATILGVAGDYSQTVIMDRGATPYSSVASASAIYSPAEGFLFRSEYSSYLGSEPPPLLADGTEQYQPRPDDRRVSYSSECLDSWPPGAFETPRRVRRFPFGYSPDFVWFNKPKELSPGAAGSWRFIDLSANLPVDAVGAVFEVVNVGGSHGYTGALRRNDRSKTPGSDAGLPDSRENSSRYRLVKIDPGRMIQGYIEHGDVEFKLLGYSLADDAGALDIGRLTEMVENR